MFETKNSAKQMKCSECGLNLPEYAFGKTEKKRTFKRCNPCFTILDR